MKRTVGTISTDRGLARIVHDDSDGELRIYYSDGGWDAEPGVFPAWKFAREFAERAWGHGEAYRDSWCLCLRPIEALRVCTSED